MPIENTPPALVPAPQQARTRRLAARCTWALLLALALHAVTGVWLIASKEIGDYFYDERFTLENVRRVYLEGNPIPTSYYWYAPLSYVPQAATLLAIDRLGKALGSNRFQVFEPTGLPTRLGIGIARGFGILFGCLSLVALHSICRRLWNTRSADFAVIALASSPWFTRGNAEFKPDALLLLLTVALFMPLERFVSGGRERNLWLAAVLAGAAGAAKLNGLLGAVPVGIACLAAGRWPRRLRLAVEAAAIAGISFLLLNPWPRAAQYYLNRVEKQWSVRSQDLDFAQMLGTMTAKLLQSNFLGPLFGLAALLGLVVALLRTRGGTSDSRSRIALALWLAYPTFYLVSMSASTRYPKENLLLQVLPFAASLAGLGLGTCTTWLGQRQPRAAGVLALGIAVFASATILQFTAGEVTPQLADRQVSELTTALEGGYSRVVGWWGDEEGAARFASSGWGGPPPTILELDDALLNDPQRLERLDCVAGYGGLPEAVEQGLSRHFSLRRLAARNPIAGFFQSTNVPWDGCRPWLRSGEPVALELVERTDGWLEAQLPQALPAHDAFTVSGRVRLSGGPSEIFVVDERIALLGITTGKRGWLPIGSERVARRISGATVRLRAAAREKPELELLLWKSPRATAETHGG